MNVQLCPLQFRVIYSMFLHIWPSTHLSSVMAHSSVFPLALQFCFYPLLLQNIPATLQGQLGYAQLHFLSFLNQQTDIVTQIFSQTRKARLSTFTQMRQRVENSHSREQYMQILRYADNKIYRQTILGLKYMKISIILSCVKEEKGKRQGLCLKRTVLQNVSGFCFLFFFSFQAVETTEGNYQLTIDGREG